MSKKNECLLREGLGQFEVMEKLRSEFSVTRMSDVLEISRQAFYAWRERGKSAHAKKDEELSELIVKSSATSRGTYGCPRIQADLIGLGEHVSRKRIARLMLENRVSGRVKRKFRVIKADPNELAPAPNELDRDFARETPNSAWVSDITYLWTSEGWLFLCVVIDLFSRRVVGWSMDETQDTALVLRSLDMAIAQRGNPSGLLFHSDRGCQYTSGDFRDHLKLKKIVCSMSRKGNCWDNACSESFFGTLKQELVHTGIWKTRADLRSAVYEYIEVFYNRNRRHSSLGFVSPAKFEEDAA
ncbi:MAG: IS3 family transposase [Planctomycetota bacterium]